MSNTDVISTILSMVSSDFVEIMVIIGGTTAVSWVIRALVNFTTNPVIGR